jgi:CheY-like chemotaxis protein
LVIDIGTNRRSNHEVISIAPKHAILIVDDDADSRDALAGVLDNEGYRSVQVENGQQALEHLSSRAHPPALILLDLDMPVMDGRQFLARLPRANGSLRPIVIVITGQDPRFVSGAVAVFRKPIQLNQLLSLMEQLLKGR